MIRVTITGSGTPLMVAGRAGPGVLVAVDEDVKLQFDAGRATSLRLTEAGVSLPDLSAVAPDGEAANIAEHLLDVWQTEMMMRANHTGRHSPAEINVRRFAAPSIPQEVFTAGTVRVSAVQVRHEPVTPAVAYRVDAADGSVVSWCPRASSRPIMTSLSTRFLGQPRLTKPIFIRSSQSSDPG